MIGQQRVDWADVLRGYGMIFIVLGHCLAGLIAANMAYGEGWARDAIIFLYLFHMPILFFVAGFVSRDHEKSVRVFAKATAQWIVLPYVVWSGVLVLAQNVMPSAANAPIPLQSLYTILWSPVSLFWFLYAFFVIKVVFYAADRLLGQPFKVALILTIVGAGGFVLAPYAGLDDGLTHKIFAGLFFYGCGRLCAERRSAFEGVMQRFDHNPGLGIITVLSGLAALLAAMIFYGAQPAAAIEPVTEPQNLFPLTGAIGIFSFLILARLTQEKRFAAPFKLAGIYSMAIYVQHVLWGAATRGALGKIGIRSELVLITVIVTAGVALPIIWQKITDRLGWTEYFGIRHIRPMLRNLRENGGR